ncbi:MAG: hypothetical protein Q4F72_10505 [Desulfovibrionaceae bacterium]|nr:hypothetical protein [Desulfovibrionaceae bacterium]
MGYLLSRCVLLLIVCLILFAVLREPIFKVVAMEAGCIAVVFAAAFVAALIAAFNS